jgi:predicted acyl esterase
LLRGDVPLRDGIAAQQPPSLKAIAPWEGCGDLFREQFVRGGVFEISNMELVLALSLTRRRTRRSLHISQKSSVPC